MGNKPTRRSFSADFDEISSRASANVQRKGSFSSGSSLSSVSSSSRRGSSVRQHFVDNQPARFEQRPTISTAPRTFATDTSFNRDGPLPSPPALQQSATRGTSIEPLGDEEKFITAGVRPAPSDANYAQSLPQATNPNYQTSLPLAQGIPVAPGLPLPPVPVAQNTPARMYYESDASTTTNSVAEPKFSGPAFFQVDEQSSVASIVSSSMYDDDTSDSVSTQLQARRRVPAYPTGAHLNTPTGSQQIIPQYVQRQGSDVTSPGIVLLKERTEPSGRVNRRIARHEGLLLIQPRGRPEYKEVVENSSLTLIKPRSTPMRSEDTESLGIQTDPVANDPIVQPVVVPVMDGGAVSNLQQIPQKPTTNILPVIIVDKDGSIRSTMPLGEVQLGLADLGGKRHSTTSGISINQNIRQSIAADSIRGPFVPHEQATVSHRGSDAHGRSMYRTIDGTARLRGLEFDVDEIAYPAGSEKLEGTVGTASHVTGPSYRLFGDASAREHHLHLMQNQVVANEA